MKSHKLLSLFAFVLLACTRQQELAPRSSLSVRIPSSQALAASTAIGSFNFGSSSSFSSYTKPGFSTFTGSSSGPDFNELLNPTALSGFDCFVVMVGGGTFSQKGMCTTSDGQTFTMGAAVGGVPAGQSITIPDVPSGNRTLVLVGFNAQSSSSCHDFFNLSLPSQSLSEPHVLAKIDQNLQPGNVSVNITAAYSTKKITSCQFADSDGVSGGYYGSGYDGDVNVTATPFHLTSQYSTSIPTRYLSSITRVNQITDVSTAALPQQAQLTVEASWTSANLGVGDEVMLYIAASSGATGCGPNLTTGMSTSGFVKSYSSGSTFTMDLFDSRFATVTASQLIAFSYGGGTPDFCRMVAIRVPHINNLTVSVPSAFIRTATNPSPLDLTAPDHTNAGIMILRVAGQLNIDSSATFDVSRSGFLGATASNTQGQGTMGRVDGDGTAARPARGNGGGGSMVYGGGGSHGGYGGLSGFAGSLVGDDYGCYSGTYDPTMKCLTGRFFMGGGGGSDTNTGGNGGGIIRIFANELIGDSTLIFDASGGPALTTYAAGGAGGSVLAQFGTVNTSGSINVVASGGNGSSANDGVGGGGRIHVQVLDQVITYAASTASVVKGASGDASGSTDGTCFAEGITLVGCP